MQLLRLDDFYFEAASFPATLPPSKAEVPLVLNDLKGRLCEFSAWGVQAVGSLAARYVWEAQLAGEWPVWISKAGVPLAEDLHACGVDLRALPVICVQTASEGFRAAERVMRSEACGVVILDLGEEAYMPASMMGRMLKLAQRTSTACIVLTNRKHPARASLSPLVSLRVDVEQRIERPAIHDEISVPYTQIDARIVRDKKTGRKDAFQLRYAACAGAY